MAKKNEIIDGLIEKVKFPNKGIMYIEEERIPVLVPDTFPGQKVRVRLQRKRKGTWEGRALEHLENPAHFVKPSCEYFGLCGGCAMQHLSYENQLEHKHEQVQTLLQNAGVTGYEDMGILGSPSEWAYRNKMEFSFGDACKDGPMTLGMHRKNSTFDIITVDGCKIVDEDFNMILRFVLRYAQSFNLPFYKKKIHEGFLRYLIVRRSETTGDLLINIVTTTQRDFDFTELANYLVDLGTKGKIAGILHTYSDTLADAVKPDSTRVLYGKDAFTETILGLQFNISPYSFFQTNTKGAELLYKTALDMPQDITSKVVFDLYSGTGTIAQIMATKAKEVYGIEIVEEAVEKAKENAKLNDLTNCHFVAGDVLKEVENFHVKPELIVLDPPREGIHPKAIDKIIGFDAKELLYISCKPTSLARDLPVFEQSGYKVEKVCCVDMFPHTHHVETIAYLVKEN
ncbi:MAG: 23S rRNA (uracil(1939)-C(5))-methyltransferase RlmD [Clostridiales bacterium]|jgi:23S rRNA (uracil1939-C5)-methyltransferase|uniref:23S rRNA (uracil(1939)-C(5))-methyltransferase RlmD n=1 Tax=Zhenhengia sp. TaxID=2944208 RepID=UPI00290B211C|nr:23S rRNA (uracil(1939)-C(5))-methyltransferase RlmD [Clostridiales bacterium]MDU6360956.1 23S rRNA (uracil(1939)-C(5))-methyltransferase RlmD [Clostridiales bacterium]